MRRFFAAIILLSPIVFAPACGRSAEICSLVCECEHCSDLAESFSCEQVSASEDIAEIYECLDEWTAYYDCFEEKGTCNEEEARYTTREEGSCSEIASSGLNCANNSDCLNTGIDGSSCDNGVCVYTSCADSGGIPCSGNSDCPGGADKCEEDAVKLTECIAEASDNVANGIGSGPSEDDN